jgi:protein SCO1
VTRAQIALGTAAACVLAAVIALYAARGDNTPSRPPGAFAGALRPPGVPPARFTLRDQDGHAVTAASLRGRPAIVSFLYTRCRDTCPLVADQVRGALDQLGARRAVPYLAVSVDPAGDTPASARAFLLHHGLTGRARFLVGPRAALAAVWRQFGVRPQRVVNARRDDHTPSTVVLDARGVQRVGFLASQITPEDVAHDVRVLSG